MPKLLQSRFAVLMAITITTTLIGGTSAFLPSSNPTEFLLRSTNLAATSSDAAAAAAAVDAPSSQFPLEFVKTPGSKETPHNFGRASPLDSVMHSAERPGNPPEKDGIVGTAEVQEWIDFIKGQGVTNVIALLEEKELAIYEEPGLQKMMSDNGMKWHRIGMGSDGAPKEILTLIEEAEARGEKVVTHCTGGIGRCGRACAAWLVHRYDLSPEVATLIVLDQAHKSGVQRLGHSEKLREWIGYSP